MTDLERSACLLRNAQFSKCPGLWTDLIISGMCLMVRIYGLFISEYFRFREERWTIGRLSCDLPGSRPRAGGGEVGGHWGHWVESPERAPRWGWAQQMDWAVIWGHTGVSASRGCPGVLGGGRSQLLLGLAEDLLIFPGTLEGKQSLDGGIWG